MDFVSDTFGASRKFGFWRSMMMLPRNLCLIADTSISGARVARELDTLVRLYGKPATIVSDNVHKSGSASGEKRPAGLVAPMVIGAGCVLIQMASIVRNALSDLANTGSTAVPVVVLTVLK
jgi:hypothetical protein